VVIGEQFSQYKPLSIPSGHTTASDISASIHEVSGIQFQINYKAHQLKIDWQEEHR
jgi:hypothetical protein